MDVNTSELKSISTTNAYNILKLFLDKQVVLKQQQTISSILEQDESDNNNDDTTEQQPNTILSTPIVSTQLSLEVESMLHSILQAIQPADQKEFNIDEHT